MKKLIEKLCIAIVAIVLFTCFTTKQVKSQTVTNRIIYDASIKNKFPDDENPYRNNIAEPQKGKFLNMILDAAMTNKINIFDKAHNQIKYDDVSSNQNNDKKDIDKTKITHIRFDEKWTMNEKTYELSKEVNGFCPVIDTINEQGVHHNQNPLFWIYPDKASNKNASDNFIITNKISYVVYIAPRDQTSDPLMDNIDSVQREKFINTIMDAVLTNKLKAYDYDGKLMTKEIFDNYFTRRDTISFQDINTDKIKDTVIVKNLDYKKIYLFKFTEEWSLNTKTFKFTKKVLTMAPSVELSDNEGNFKGYVTPFIIYFDKSLIPKN